MQIIQSRKFYWVARLLPTVLTIVPILIVFNKSVNLLCYEPLHQINNIVPLAVEISFSAAIMFLLVHVNRLIGIELFQKKYFKDELHMPATNHLLFKDSFFDNKTKLLIRKKIKDKFDMQLLGEQGEISDELTARKRIVPAVSMIRNYLRGNKLLLQHNIEYNFFRNLAGGCIIAIMFSLVILVYSILNKNTMWVNISLILLIIYLLPVIFSRYIINRFGCYYSKTLYEQFLSL